ncbi:MAG: methylenetetrahydrofolate--tRNA-(uracil(54)-C(5))-methyltransferase (FADH(2)-oxidizing) TrmFO [Chthonomonas sp.]|nr:methylenetetrahydrofolate--tRNA-(uracil(54)-C(5))-methyltransferase (FADH(2)-oxidizing) TrmFO [Chthonomonas sp.]
MISVVGAGFAGVEAAWAIASRGHHVRLFEMRPSANTPAHETSWFAELVCSNSFKSKSPTSPAGLLKAEMQALGSLVLAVAAEHAVPGGEALAVDRTKFSEAITDRLSSHPNVSVVREEATGDQIDGLLADGPVILATGPLTSPSLSSKLAEWTGRKHLYFYDAVAPTVTAESLDRSIIFAQSRYDKGEGDDYLNCPFGREEYEAFVEALVAADRAPIHAFEAGGKRDASPAEVEVEFLEKIKYFSGCSPIEAIAEKGARSLAFGNFKPVGLTDPRTGRRPYAALQLRPENREKSMYSLVACQTRLKWGEQKRVFQMVPGLQNAEFVRYGVIHRNTFVDAPSVLERNLQVKGRPNLYLSGQLTGVEGYVESAAMGIMAGLLTLTPDLELPPRPTALGSLFAHLQDDSQREFAPMNINWGLLPDPEPPTRDKGQKRAIKLENAHRAFAEWAQRISVE